MLEVCSFNVRGLNSKQTYIKDFLLSNKISLIALLETHVTEPNAVRISSFVAPRFSWYFNYNNSPNGRIWLGWDNEIWNVDILYCTAQVIHCSVRFLQNNVTFFCSFVYAYNDIEDRRHLWDELKKISTNIDIPW